MQKRSQEREKGVEWDKNTPEAHVTIENKRRLLLVSERLKIIFWKGRSTTIREEKSLKRTCRKGTKMENMVTGGLVDERRT